MNIILSAVCVLFGILLVNAALPQVYYPSLLALKECRSGPGYWCSNISNAKNCHALRYCIYNVWEKQVVPEDNNTICQICLDMVKNGRIQFRSNEREDHFKAVFAGSCQSIPHKSTQKECMKLINDFSPEITEILSSQIPSEVVCTVAELCNNSNNDKMLEEDVTVTYEGKTIPSTVGITTDELPENKFLVENRIPFKEENIQAIESLIGKLMEVSQYEAKIERERICSLCNLFLLFTQEALSTPINEDKIKLIVNTTCTKLPSSIRAECHNFVDEFGDIGIALLIEKINPSQICPILKLCPKHAAPLKASTSQTLVLFVNINSIDKPSFAVKQPQHMIGDGKPEGNIRSFDSNFPNKLKDNEIYDAVDSKIAPIYHDAEDVASQCSMCIKLVNEVEAKVKDKNSKDQIENAMEMVCRKHRLFKNKCEQYIKIHGKEIENFIMNGYSQKKICSSLGWCSWREVFNSRNNEDIASETSYSETVPIETTVIASPPCVLCEFVMLELEQELSNKKFQDEIKSIIQNICGKMPKTIAANCKKFIDEYSDLVINVIDSVPPKEICQKIYLCSRISNIFTDKFS